MLSWGLIPGWTEGEEKARKIRYMTFNARAETLALTNARLIDGTGSAVKDNVSIIIKNNRFSAIIPGTDIDEEKYERVIDLEDRTVLPGLIDAHFHMNYPDFSDKPPLLNEAICAYRVKKIF